MAVNLTLGFNPLSAGLNAIGGGIKSVANDAVDWTKSLFGTNTSTAPKSSPTPKFTTTSSPTTAPASIAPAYTPAPVPVLPTYNIAANWTKALQAATTAVNPVYAQKLNDFLNTQTVALTGKQTDVNNQKSALDTALAQLQEDTTTQQQRAQEDATSNIGSLQAAQAYNALTQGLSFDTANRQANTAVSANGLAGSGLGQQAVTEAQKTNRIASNEGVRQEATQEAAVNTSLNRTFQDLGTALTRQTSSTATQKGNLDVDLQQFIAGQQADLQSEKDTEEAMKQSDILTAASNNQKTDVQNWIASLAGSGYSPASIALAAQVYG